MYYYIRTQVIHAVENFSVDEIYLIILIILHRDKSTCWSK